MLINYKIGVYNTSALIICWFILLLPQLSHTSEFTTNELMTQEKQEATYVYKILKFINWNDAQKPKNGLKLCIITSNSKLRTEIKKLSGKTTIWGKIKVVSFSYSPTSDELNKQCNVLFSDKNKSYSPFKPALHNSGIVSISKPSGIPFENCIFYFVRVKSKLKFKINLSLAKKNKIKIRSTLLKMAEDVI